MYVLRRYASSRVMLPGSLTPRPSRLIQGCWVTRVTFHFRKQLCLCLCLCLRGTGIDICQMECFKFHDSDCTARVGLQIS
jgi:hypothetical protein